MPLPRISQRLLLSISLLASLGACASPEERAAKRQLKLERQEQKAQRIVDRANNKKEQAVTDPVARQKSAPDELLKAFASCDSAMFKVAAQYKAELAAYWPIATKGDIGNILVPDRGSPDKHFVAARNTPTMLNLPISGYFDEVMTLGTASSPNYWWGFFTPLSPRDTYRILSLRLPELKRIRADKDGAYVRLDRWDGNTWRRMSNPSSFHGMPTDTAERVLIIDKSDQAAYPGTRIACSLQGPVPATTLQSLRPDLQ